MILNYKEIGEGEPLVILHGLYGSLDNWMGIARDLKNYCKVILVDLRNHGRSQHAEDHNYDVMVDDLVHFLGKMNLYQINLMGHSMGGKLAMMFAALNPERVKRLIVVDISPRSYSIKKGDIQLIEHKNILEALIDLELSELSSREEVDFILSKKVRNKRVRSFLLKNLYRNSDKSFIWRLNLSVLYKNLHAVLQGLELYYDDIKISNFPTLFIKGENSEYIMEEDVKLIKEIYQNNQIEIIKNASHWVHAEQPMDFIDRIKVFLF